jgi:hypothetical protein
MTLDSSLFDFLDSDRGFHAGLWQIETEDVVRSSVEALQVLEMQFDHSLLQI